MYSKNHFHCNLVLSELLKGNVLCIPQYFCNRRNKIKFLHSPTPDPSWTLTYVTGKQTQTLSQTHPLFLSMAASDRPMATRTNNS